MLFLISDTGGCRVFVTHSRSLSHLPISWLCT